jgi:hypothetical protein
VAIGIVHDKLRYGEIGPAQLLLRCDDLSSARKDRRTLWKIRTPGISYSSE